jgi:hypothetical protein
MRQGRKYAQVDTLDALQLVQWAFGRADRVEANHPEEAAHLRELAAAAMSGIVLVLKSRLAPVPATVVEALSQLGDLKERRKVA